MSSRTLKAIFLRVGRLFSKRYLCFLYWCPFVVKMIKITSDPVSVINLIVLLLTRKIMAEFFQLLLDSWRKWAGDSVYFVLSFIIFCA